MEKEIGSKEVKMEGSDNGKSKRLTYDQLNQACADMSQQIQQQNKYIHGLHKQMAEMQMVLQTRRMDYLFKVVELSKTEGLWSFEHDFVITCLREIQDSLTIPEQEGKEDNPKEN